MHEVIFEKWYRTGSIEDIQLDLVACFLKLKRRTGKHPWFQMLSPVVPNGYFSNYNVCTICLFLVFESMRYTSPDLFLIRALKQCLYKSFPVTERS